MGINDFSYPPVATTQEPSRHTVAICGTCGGKFRPAGGPCIHEHPAPVKLTKYDLHCGKCQDIWRPGHTCIPQPTEKDVRELWEQGYWTHVMEDILDKLDYGPSVATPESWESV